MYNHITLAGADTPERQTLAAIVAQLSKPDPSVNYQLRDVYDGPWVIAGEGPWGLVRPGEVRISALWTRTPTAVRISRSGEVRTYEGADLTRPALSKLRAIVEAYQDALAERSAA